MLEKGRQESLWFLRKDFKFAAQQMDGLHTGKRAQVLDSHVCDAETDLLAADVALDLFRRAVGDNLPLVDDDDALRQGICLFQVVGGEDDRFALRDLAIDLVPEVAARLHIESGGRFIEKKHVGIAGRMQ